MKGNWDGHNIHFLVRKFSTQANFVWNGDIVLNVAMAGGGVDWLGLLGLAIIIGVAWVIASRKR